MNVPKIMPGFGVEITGIDLSVELANDQFAELFDLNYQHGVLLFRKQDLSPHEQSRLCHRFGQPKIETRKQFNFRECPEVSTIGPDYASISSSIPIITFEEVKFIEAITSCWRT